MNYERLNQVEEDKTEWLIDEEQAEIETQEISTIMNEVNYPEPLAA